MFPASDLIREYGLGQNTCVPLRALLNTEALKAAPSPDTAVALAGGPAQTHTSLLMAKDLR